METIQSQPLSWCGTDRWPSTSDSNFYVSVSHIHVEYNWESDHHIPHFSGSSPKTPMYCFLQKFALLEISFTTACNSQIFIQHSNRWQDNYIYYLYYSSVFYWCLWSNRVFSPGCHVLWPLWPSANPCIMWLSWTAENCQRLVLCCWISGLLIILPPLILFLKFKILWLKYNWLFFFCDASPDSTMLRHMAHRTVSYCLCCADHSDPCVCCSILHIHHQNHSKTPSAQQKEKSFFYLFFSHMIVVSITYGSCIFVYVKISSAKESVAINKGVTVLMTSIAPMLNPFIYTLRNKQVRQAFSDSFKKFVIMSKKQKTSQA